MNRPGGSGSARGWATVIACLAAVAAVSVVAVVWPSATPSRGPRHEPAASDEAHDRGASAGTPDRDVDRRDVVVEPGSGGDSLPTDEPVVEIVALWRADRSPAVDVQIALVRPGFTATAGLSRYRRSTGPEGRVRFQEVPPGAWMATATRDDAVPLWVVPGLPTRAEILVEGHGAIEGTVRDDSGRPVPDVAIRSGGNSVPHASEVSRTDAQGRFHFRAPGPDVLVWADRSTTHTRSAEVALTTYDGERHRIGLLVARTTGSVKGQVFDASGRPLPDATVTVLDTPPRSPDHPVEASVDLALPQTSSDALGRFTLEALHPGPLRWRAEAPGHVPQQGMLRLAAGSASELTIRLERGATVVGSVRTPDGRPVAGARVLRDRRDAAGVLTDSEGEFVCDGLLPGPRFVTARHPGFGTHRVVADLQPAERRRVDFVLEPGLALEGRVVDSAGAPVPAVVVDRSDALTITDDDGRFRFVDCEDRSYDLEVRARLGRIPSLLGERRAVRPRTGTVEIVVDPASSRAAGWIRGRFERPAGHQDAPLRIRLRRSEGDGPSFVVGVPLDGTLVVGPLPPGLWDLQAVANASPLDGFQRERVLLAPGGTADLGTLQVAPPTTLVVQPTVDGTAPPREIHLVLRPLDVPGIRTSLRWRDGVTSPVRGYRPGRWQIDVRPTDHHLGTRVVVDLAPGIQNPIPIRLVGTRACRFSIVGAPEGVDLSTARLTLRGGHELTGVPMNGGKATLGVPRGEHIALVEGRGFSGSAVFQIDSTDGSTLPVEITVSR